MHSYVIMILLFISLVACQEKNCTVDLPGQWTLVSHSADKEKIIEKLKSEVNEQTLQQMIASGSLEESIKNIVEAHATIEFTTDGKCKNAHQKSTDYSLSDDCKQLFFSSSPSGKDYYAISHLTNQSMELEYFGVLLKFKKDV